MTTRHHLRAAVLAIACVSLVVSTAAQTRPPRSLLRPLHRADRDLRDRPRHVHQTDVVVEQEAQAFFDQGFQMMYAFAKPEAVRSFREAWKRDPDCAICYWGEAWAWGSYLNAPMNAEEAPHAYAAVQKALSLKSRADGKGAGADRRDGGALRGAVRRGASGSNRIGPTPTRCRRSSAQYPDDLEIATLYADALFLLEPRRGTRDVNDPNVHRLHQVLESILARDVHHPGACHLYVHATESTVVPGRAEACAEFLGRRFPAPATSTTCRRTRGTKSAAGATRCARISRRGIRIRRPRSVRASRSIPNTTCTCCCTPRRTTARAPIAMRAGKDYTKLTGDSFYEVLTLIRFGRFDEVLEVTNRPKPEVQGGLWDFAQGYAHLKQGQADFARLYLARVKKAADTSTAGIPHAHGEEPARRSPPAFSKARFSGRRAISTGAIAAFERAADRQEALVYDEPEPLPFSAFHWLGAALLEARRFDEAETGVPRRAEGSPAQRLVAARVAAGARGQGQSSHPRSMRISQRAGRARTPGSARRASDRGT